MLDVEPMIVQIKSRKQLNFSRFFFLIISDTDRLRRDIETRKEVMAVEKKRNTNRREATQLVFI